ncbi:hypothetical protein P4S72_22185 [Vibrio sp. PP-XX7]
MYRVKDGRSQHLSVNKIQGSMVSAFLSFLNLDHVETTLVSNKAVGLSKAELAIGETVGFINSKDNQEHIGQVSKLKSGKGQ